MSPPPKMMRYFTSSKELAPYSTASNVAADVPRLNVEHKLVSKKHGFFGGFDGDVNKTKPWIQSDLATAKLWNPYF